MNKFLKDFLFSFFGGAICLALKINYTCLPKSIDYLLTKRAEFIWVHGPSFFFIFLG
jgi:hypothetical protein